MKDIILKFEDDEYVNHLFALKDGLHYRCYPTASQFKVEFLNLDGTTVITVETKLEFANEQDLEIIQELDFFDEWSEEIPDLVKDFFMERYTMDERLICLNCLEDFLTEVSQESVDALLHTIQERYNQTR